MAKFSEHRKSYEIVTNRITSLLEKGEVPWRKPWASGEPVNFITKKPYRGINPFILISSGFSCPYWVSFKQAKGKAGRIKKGEKGFPVIFWKWIDVEEFNSEPGKNRIPFLRYYTVFNLEQTEGIEIPEPETRDFHPIQEAEKVIHEMPDAPVIEHNEPRAYYRPSDDVVNMPKANLFQSDQEYYSTLFHELTHSTGHGSRLNRDEISKISLFGSHDYSKEELVAELGAAFLCGHCGIEPSVIENQAAYIQGWLKKLQRNKKWLVYAAAKAQKASDFILGIQHEEKEFPARLPPDRELCKRNPQRIERNCKMTLSQKRQYSNVEELKAYLNNLKTKKYRLDCGHHVTFGFFLGNDVMVINGKDFKIICSQCAY